MPAQIKTFTITQEDASEELKEIQITSDGSSALVNLQLLEKVF